MPLIQRLSFTAGVLIFWANLSFGQSPQSVCNTISRKGKLKVKSPSSIPVGVYQCSNLVHLRFRRTHIRELPPGIVSATFLKSLNLAHTDITRFPRAVLKLRNLEELDLSFTGVSYLPAEIAQMKNLKILKLRGTHIAALPDGLDHLEKIDLQMNDLSREQQEALRCQYPQVKIYFSSPCNCK